jgi:hypothetical protein
MATANTIRLCGEPEDACVIEMHRDWCAYRNWLNGDDCRDMDDAEFGMHIEELCPKVGDGLGQAAA